MGMCYKWKNLLFFTLILEVLATDLDIYHKFKVVPYTRQQLQRVTKQMAVFSGKFN